MTIDVKQKDEKTIGYACVVEVSVTEDGSLEIVSQTSDGFIFNHYNKSEWHSMKAK